MIRELYWDIHFGIIIALNYDVLRMVIGIETEKYDWILWLGCYLVVQLLSVLSAGSVKVILWMLFN